MAKLYTKLRSEDFMKVKQFVFAALLSLGTLAFAASDKVVGYFPYWSQYSQFAPKDIRYHLVTHVHYVSLSPTSDGTLAFADENDVENFKELSKLSAENGVKLIVTVGGMEQEGTLAEIAASEELRGTFASNVASWLDENGAAGVELDWQNLTAENAEGFSALVNALKAALGEKTLAVATYPLSSSDAYNGTALNEAEYVTVFVPDQMTEESSELKPNQSVSAFEEASNALVAKGVDKAKLVPVVFFYGKSFTGAKALGDAQTGVGSGNEGILSYQELMKKFETPDYQVSFDESSKSEIATSEMESIVFMGIPSVKALADWVKEEGCAGVAAYDLSEDHQEPIVSLLVTIGLELRPDIDYKAKKK